MRPLLAPGAFLRTYVGDGARYWVLVRAPGQGRVRLDARGRAIVELCDGSRDLEELARAASERAPRALEAREAREVVLPLLSAGALLDLDVDEPPAPRATTGGLILSALPAGLSPSLSIAPDTGFSCDGRGGCCRLYDRIEIADADVENLARAYGTERTPGGLTLESAIRRDGAGEAHMLAVLAVVEGACAILEPDGRCGVHRLLGEPRKPAACRTYPLRDVLCGDELHVGVAVECRCAIDLHKGPPIDEAARALLARRRETGLVESVAERIPIAPGRLVPRAEYLAWRAAATARLEGADPIQFALAEAGGLTGRDPRPLDSFLEPARSVHRWLHFEAENTRAVYPESDLQRRLFEWGETAAAHLIETLGKARQFPAPTDGETLLVEQILHTHALLRNPTLTSGLHSLALRLALARTAKDLPIPGELHPVSAAEYLARAYGFGGVLDG